MTTITFDVVERLHRRALASAHTIVQVTAEERQEEIHFGPLKSLSAETG
jgi:hypothetical protein